MNSTRLPNKVLLKIGDKSMLHLVVNQTRNSKLIDEIIIATTTSTKDKAIVNFCTKNGLYYFRGSSNDVLDRYYKCAKKFSCDYIVRISSDCPFIDSIVIDKVISKFLKNSYDYIGTNLDKVGSKWENATCNFPQGMAVEICKFNILEKAWKRSKKPSEREHVFPYVQFNPKSFKVSNIKNKIDLSFIRCTVDRKEDLKFVREIRKRIPDSKKIIHISDIVSIIKKEPNLIKINNKILFDEGYQKSLQADHDFYKRNNIKSFSSFRIQGRKY